MIKTGERFGHILVSLEITRSLQKVLIIAIDFLGVWYVSPSCWKWPRVTSTSSSPSSILRTTVNLYSRNFPWRLGCSLTCSIRVTRFMGLFAKNLWGAAPTWYTRALSQTGVSINDDEIRVHPKENTFSPIFMRRRVSWNYLARCVRQISVFQCEPVSP